MTTINLEPAWFVASVTSMKRKHPFSITQGAAPFFGVHPSALTTSTAMIEAANQETRKEKIEELLLARIKEQRLRESGVDGVDADAVPKQVIKVEPQEKSTSPHKDLSPETLHILEIVKILHTKKRHEETKEGLETLDNTIATLRDKIRVLTEEKHELVSNLKLVLNQEVVKRNQEEAFLKQQQAAKQQQQLQQLQPPFSMIQVPMSHPTQSAPGPSPLQYFARPNVELGSGNQFAPPVLGVPGQMMMGGPPVQVMPQLGPMINSQNPSPAHPSQAYGMSDRSRLYNSGDAEMTQLTSLAPGISSQSKDFNMDRDSPSPSPIDSRSMNHRQHLPSQVPPYPSYDRDRDRGSYRDRERDRDRDRDRYSGPSRSFQSPEPRRDEPWRGRGGMSSGPVAGRYEPYPSPAPSYPPPAYDRGRGAYRGPSTPHAPYGGGGGYHSNAPYRAGPPSGNPSGGPWRGRGGSSSYRGGY